jgi:hypothetical protein
MRRRTMGSATHGHDRGGARLCWQGLCPRSKGKCIGILRKAGVIVVRALTPHSRNGHNPRSTQHSNVPFRERGDRRNGEERAGTVILVLSAVAIVLMILLL